MNSYIFSPPPTLSTFLCPSCATCKVGSYASLSVCLSGPKFLQQNSLRACNVFKIFKKHFCSKVVVPCLFAPQVSPIAAWGHNLVVRWANSNIKLLYNYPSLFLERIYFQILRMFHFIGWPLINREGGRVKNGREELLKKINNFSATTL